jgi:tetratricopeptide (TPR) repeat protein
MNIRKNVHILLVIGILCHPLTCRAKAEAWVEISSPHFVVVSDGSSKQAVDTARSLEQFRQLIKRVLHTLDVEPKERLKVFAIRSGKTWRELIALGGQTKNERDAAGVFISGLGENLIVLRADILGNFRYQVAYHEYVHLLVQANYGELPLWLREGLAEFFGNAVVKRGEATLGKASPRWLAVLKSRGLMPLEILFEVTERSPYYREKEKVDIFYAQSWALTHYLEIGDNLAHAKQLNDFTMLIRKKIPWQEAAKQAFGDLKLLEGSLQRYIQSWSFNQLRISTQPETRDEPYQTRTLSQAESLALRGELLVNMNNLDRARSVLESSLKLDPRNLVANEAMLQLFLRLKDIANARKYAHMAAGLGSQNYMAQFQVAQMELGQSSYGDSDFAERQLRAVIALNLQFAPAYRALSYVLQKKSNLPQALEMAKMAAMLEPLDLNYKLNVANISLGLGDLDRALSISQRVAAVATAELDRAKAEEIIAAVRQEHFWGNNAVDGKQDVRETSALEGSAVNAGTGGGRVNAPDSAKGGGLAEIARLAVDGSVVTLEGMVRSVKCRPPAEANLVFEVNGVVVTLHTDDYASVEFKTAGFSQRKTLEPCRDLQGMRVSIEYRVDPGKHLSGAIKSIVCLQQ